MNMQKMMKQVQKMQKDMAKVQDELGEKTVKGTSGGGMVEVTANGHQEILSLRINPDAVDPEDVEMLEDLVLAAVNEAMKLAKELAEDEMKQVTGGMNIPGLF